MFCKGIVSTVHLSLRPFVFLSSKVFFDNAAMMLVVAQPLSNVSRFAVFKFPLSENRHLFRGVAKRSDGFFFEDHFGVVWYLYNGGAVALLTRKLQVDLLATGK